MVQLAILVIYILLLIFSVVGIFPMAWPNVILCYLGTAQAVGVLQGRGWIKT